MNWGVPCLQPKAPAGRGPIPINLQSSFCQNSLVAIERERWVVMVDNLTENDQQVVYENLPDVPDYRGFPRLLTMNGQGASCSHSMQS